jgi:hypothetical protein
MDWKDYFRAVEKWEQGEQLDEREARIVAYGWTAGTCGQRVRPDDAVKVKVARTMEDDRDQRGGKGGERCEKPVSAAGSTK